jgi:hypothetical protein
MKYWEIIADKLSAAGYTWGYSGAVTREGCATQSTLGAVMVAGLSSNPTRL